MSRTSRTPKDLPATLSPHKRKTAVRAAAAHALKARGWSVREIHEALNTAPQSPSTVQNDLRREQP